MMNIQHQENTNYPDLSLDTFSSKYQISDPTFTFPYTEGTSFEYPTFSSTYQIIKFLNTEIKEYLLKEELASSTISSLIKDETNFILKVAVSLEKSKETSLTHILWDIDETLGGFSTESYYHGWLFRPSMIPLMIFLKENYPEIKHGILTARGLAMIEDKKSSTRKIIDSVPWFWDYDNLHSSSGELLDEHLLKFKIILREYFTNSEYELIKVAKKPFYAQSLKNKGLNFLYIDDFDLTGCFEDSSFFIYVGDCTPTAHLKEIGLWLEKK